MELEMAADVRGRSVRVPVPLLYFVSENLAFLVRFLLHYQMRVDTLVHIKDGGRSMGGSRITMDFIYQVADNLRLKRVVCDGAPKDRLYDIKEGRLALEKEIENSRQAGNRFDVDYRRLSGREICNAWEAEKIPLEKMRPNVFTPPSGHYYNWQRRHNPPSASRIPMARRAGRGRQGDE